MSKYHFYEDPSHGWLRVPKKELEDMNIAQEISKCSYMRGKYAYLEEDRDMSIFVGAVVKRDGSFSFQQDTITHVANRNSKIRSYDDYRASGRDQSCKDH